MKHRLLSIITALALCLSLCPAWVFAAEIDPALCKHHPAHTGECGYAAPTEGQPCGHEHTEDCYTADEAGGEVLDCQHTHDEDCGYVQADPGQPCGFVCPLCPIEDLIAALPDEVTPENADDVRARLDEILALFSELTGDEQEQIDLSRVYELQGALDGANDPDPVEGEVSTAYREASWNGSEVIYTDRTENCTSVESSADAVTWNAGWYAVSGTVTIDQPITVEGEVHLILTDGCDLTAAKGIVVTTGNSLTIYAQTNGTGTLTATGTVDGNNASAGIGGSTASLDSGTITIHGGVIHATGGKAGYYGGAGIGGSTSASENGGNSGTITIYGGTVTANSGTGNVTGAGIGGGSSSSGTDGAVGGDGSGIIIYGGDVTATSKGTVTGGAGIGGGGATKNGGAGSNIQIFGGRVTATGGKCAAGIGGGSSSEAGSGGDPTKSGDGAVTISGGIVTAVGSDYAAGIGGGGGYEYTLPLGSPPTTYTLTGGTGNVTISGGIVDASSPTDVRYADYKGAPIGNGGNTTTEATVNKTTGIVFENGAGTVCGNVTFDGSYDVPAGYSLHIPAGASLSGSGTLTGGGAFTTDNITADMISVPEDLVYTGADLTDVIRERTSLSGEVTLCGKTFTADTEGWELAVRRGADLVYTVFYNRTNPAGTVMKNVLIARRSLADAAVSITGTYTYTGSAHRPEPFVFIMSGKLLAVDEDYTVSYADNINAGTATVTVTGKGNYKGTVEKTFTIERATLTANGAGIAMGTYGDQLSQLTVGGLTVSTDSGSGVSGSWTLTGDAIPNVGDTGPYEAAYIPVSGAENYKPLTAQVTLDIAKAPALPTKTGDLAVANQQEHTYTYGLGALLPDVQEGMSLGSTAVTYELGTVSLGSYYDSAKDGAKIEGQTLTLPIEAVDTEDVQEIGTVTVIIHTQNFEDITAAIKVRSVNKTVPTGGPTLSGTTLTYGQALSAITLSGSMQDNGTTVPGTFVWSNPDNRPAAQERYAAAWTFTPDENVTYAIVTGTATVQVLPAPIAGAVIVLEPSAFRYDGAAHHPGIASVTLDGTALTADVDYTAAIPEGAEAGAYTVTLTGKGNYAGKATAAFTINPVEQKPLEQKDDNGNELRLEVETGLSTVPAALKANEQFNTPEKIETALRTKVAEVLSNVGEQIAVFDVTLQYKDNSGVWHNVDPNHFPAEGVTAVLPYPAGTGASGYTFTVQHLISSGGQAGTMETLAYTLTADGLHCKFSSLSPVAIGYQAAAKPNPGGGSGGGGSASTYAVTVEKSEHGKVTSNRTNADGGSTVTLTIAPDSGYVLDVLTVTDSRGNEIKLTAQGGGRYTFTMPSRAVTVKATFAPLLDDTQTLCNGGPDCPSRGFTDLGGVGMWYHEAVDYVLQNGLMGGYGSRTFEPNDHLSRAQFIQILFNKEGRPVVNYLLQYGDVAEGMWCTEAVRWAASRGIIGGYGNRMFGPGDNITREQSAVMLWRYAGSPVATEKELHFTDADKASGYALEALRWAVENGIINGKGGGVLDPQGLATRAQAAQMLVNFLKDE